MSVQASTFIIALSCFWVYGPAAAQPKSDIPSQIAITIETSRPQLAAGREMGIIAELKNLSATSKAYFYEKYITLTFPPEIELLYSTSWYGRFPTEPDIAGDSLKDDFSNSICLQPGDAYKVFWAQNLGILSQFKFITFSPGDYKLTVVAKYWTDSSSFREKNKVFSNYHTVQQSSTFNIAAPEFVILLGAAIGGIVAYILFPQIRRRSFKRRSENSPAPAKLERLVNATKIIVGLLGSMLLSVIITILLNRISEAQYLIRVTIADFWGAIAIGFIANYLGSKLLDKIISPADPNHPAERQNSNG